MYTVWNLSVDLMTVLVVICPPIDGCSKYTVLNKYQKNQSKISENKSEYKRKTIVYYDRALK